MASSSTSSCSVLACCPVDFMSNTNFELSSSPASSGTATVCNSAGGTNIGVSASSNHTMPRATSFIMSSDLTLRSTFPDMPDVYTSFFKVSYCPKVFVIF